MIFEAANSWLSSHEPLANLLLTLALSVLVGGASAWFSYRTAVRAARGSRVHQSALEISRYRQAWIDALRDDLAEFSGIAVIAYEGEPPREKIERMALLQMRIRMRMNRGDPDYVRLVRSIHGWTQNFGGHQPEMNDDEAAIVSISQDILKREWERLKADLRAADR